MNNQKHVPTKLKILRNTYRDDRDGQSLTVAPISKIPTCPDYFDDDIKKMWYEISGTLYALGILQSIGVTQIEIYCKQFDIYKKAVGQVDKYGITIVSKTKYGQIMKKNPAIEVMSIAITIMQGISDRFGFSPLSQSKIKNVQVGNIIDGKEKNKFEDRF